MKSAPQMEIERAVGVNRQRVQDFINELSGLDDDKFVIGEYDCGTAACIMGWWRRLYMEKEEIGRISGIEHMARELGVGSKETYAIMTMSMNNSSFHPSPMDAFDALPGAQRKACMIRVLELLMESGKCEWPAALADVLEPEELQKFRYHEAA